MTIYLKYDLNLICETVVKEQLDKLGITYFMPDAGKVKINEKLAPERENELAAALNKYGIKMLNDQKTILVQRIKDAITEMVYGEKPGPYKISIYLSEKLNYSYTHLSNIFPQVTHTSIENFVILKKIDRVKDLIVNHDLTLTEVAHKLNYSSLAHLSSQFKKATGLTPSAFQRIIEKRK